MKTRFSSSKLTIICILVAAFGTTIPPVAAQDSSQEQELKELTTARRSFEDKLYDIALTKLSEFINKYPQSKAIPEAVWLKGQAHYFEGQLNEALDIFTSGKGNNDSDLKAKYAYWKAMTLQAMERWQEAQQAYLAFSKQWSQNKLADEAKIAASLCDFQLGNRDAASKALEPLVKLDVDTPTGQKARIVKIRFLIASGELIKAASIIKQLEKLKTKDPLKYEIAYWKGELLLEQRKPEEAVKSFNKLTRDSKATPRSLVAKAWMGEGRAWQVRYDWPRAFKAFERAYQVAQRPDTIEASVVLFLESHFKNNSLNEGALKVREYARKNKGAAVAGILAIAKYHSQSGAFDKAISELDLLINTFKGSTLIWPARYMMGEAFSKKGSDELAIKSFQLVAGQKINPTLARRALVEISRIHYRRGDFQKASTSYLTAAQAANETSLKETLTYRALVSIARSRDLNMFLSKLEEFKKRYAKSSQTPRLMLELGRLYNDLNNHVEATKTYNKLIKTSKLDKTIKAQALFQLASSYFWLGQYEEARKVYLRIEKEHTDSPQLAEARFKRILASKRSNKISAEKAASEFQLLLKSMKNNPLRASVSFQIGEILFNEENFADARLHFDRFATNYPKHALRADALYYAGRSAMRLKDYKGAIDLFEQVPEGHALKSWARLAQLRSYMEQGEHVSALTIAEALTGSKSDDYIWTEAMLRRANCLYTIAAKEPLRYEEALKIINQVISARSASISQIHEAGWLKGKVLQKQNRKEEAQEAFLDVLYGQNLPPEFQSIPPKPEYFWFTKCGVEIAQMREDSGDVKSAVEIYRLLERRGGPNQAIFTAKIEEIRTRHFIYDNQ